MIWGKGLRAGGDEAGDDLGCLFPQWLGISEIEINTCMIFGVQYTSFRHRDQRILITPLMHAYCIEKGFERLPAQQGFLSFSIDFCLNLFL